jgi:hypothetical protein
VGGRKKAHLMIGPGKRYELPGGNKARVFLSGLILAALLAGAGMLRDKKGPEGAAPDQTGSAQGSLVQVAQPDSGGEERTTNDEVNSAGKQDRRYFPGRQAM